VRDRVLRMAEERFEVVRSAPHPPLELPLDLDWTGSGATVVTRVEKGLRVSNSSQRPGLHRVVSFRAEQYNELRIVMKTDAGTKARLSWKNELEPPGGTDLYAEVSIVPDNVFHTYVFLLSTIDLQLWTGAIDRIELTLSDQPATVELASCQFGFDPSAAPLRFTLDNCTHQALLGTQAPWEFVVPPAATFEVSLGMSPRAWLKCNSDGVRFKVTLDAGSGRSTVLLDEVAKKAPPPGKDWPWKRLEEDLSDYAGQKVSVQLEVEPLKTTTGDYAFWGDPLVCSRAKDTTSIPVILISCDTFRADHLSCYGYSRETTPHLDAFAKEAVLFENVTVEEVWTPTSHMTMLTGLYPKHHGMTPNANLAEEIITLPEALAGEDYLTAGFTGHRWWLLPWRGFSHGFDVYDVSSGFRDIFETKEKVVEWLRQHPVPRFFLFFHNYDLHTKSSDDKNYARNYDTGDPEYTRFLTELKKTQSLDTVRDRTTLYKEVLRNPNPVANEEERVFLKACYDDCIRYVDQGVFEFFESLKALGLYDRALIIVTADHGEAFGEHEFYGHGQVYQEDCHVPLLIKFPGGRFAGRRVKGLVELADLYPTILDVLGISCTAPVDGKSLVPLIETGRSLHPVVYTQRLAWQAACTEDRKLIRNVSRDTFELYDWVNDPRERRNILETEPVEGTEIGTAFESFFDEEPDGWRLRFSNDGTDWAGAIRVVTDDRFDVVRLKRSDRHGTPEIRWDSHALEGVIRLYFRIHEDVLFLKPASPDARLYVSLESTVPFDIHAGSTMKQDATSCRLVLDPSDSSFSAPPESEQSSGEKPVLRVWYRKGRIGGTAAKDLPPEGVDALRALGYVE